MDIHDSNAINEERTLCAASAYKKKYYLNPMFEKLPEGIKQELQIISVLFVEEIGGRFVMGFDEEGNLLLQTDSLASDYNYDDIGAALMIKEIQKNRGELLSQLEMFYKVMVLGQSPDDLF